MDNIFDNNNLYPGYDISLKEYFQDYFNSVFICFCPFFFLQNDDKKNRSLRQAEIISLKEFQGKNEILKKLDPLADRVIYTNNNFKYPKTEEMILSGAVVKWEYIKEKGNFKSYADINIALRTSIGGLNKEFSRRDLQERLDKVTDDEFIYNPAEGRINPLSLVQIYNCLKALGKTEIVIIDEFFEDRKIINLEELTSSEFVLQFHGYMFYFPTDKSLLFTIEWDSFFYLIAGDRSVLNEIIAKFEFEGFYAIENMYHNWEFE